jgi:hypothetical protein
MMHGRDKEIPLNEDGTKHEGAQINHTQHQNPPPRNQVLRCTYQQAYHQEYKGIPGYYKWSHSVRLALF